MASTNSFVGKQISNYIVKEELASGSFGSVYQAEHMILAGRTLQSKYYILTFLRKEVNNLFKKLAFSKDLNMKISCLLLM